MGFIKFCKEDVKGFNPEHERYPDCGFPEWKQVFIGYNNPMRSNPSILG